MPDEEKVRAVREALPATAAGLYLNTGTAGPVPAETAKAMADSEASELAIGRAHKDYWPDTLVRIDEARAAVAAVVGGRLDEIALTHATTFAMNAAVWSVPWQPGDRAVTTRHEHAGGLAALYAVRDRFGIELAFVEPDPDGDDVRTVAAFDRAVTPGTRLVAVSHVLWTTGALLPVRQIAEIGRARGARVVVDGAQAAGTIPVSVADTGADFYALAGQKWLLGPEGTGALWCDRAAIDEALVTFAGYPGFESITADGAVRQPDARRFQVSGFNRGLVIGLARSCGWLSMFVGLDWIHARATTLAARTRATLGAISGVRVLTPERMATLVTFTIDGWPAEAALDELGGRVFAIARAIPALDAIRVSVGFFNTDDEIDRLADCVRLLARHRPGTLPPRRLLTIVNEA